MRVSEEERCARSRVVIPDCNRGTFLSRPVYAQISIRCAALGLIKTTLTPIVFKMFDFLERRPDITVLADWA